MAMINHVNSIPNYHMVVAAEFVGFFPWGGNNLLENTILWDTLSQYCPRNDVRILFTCLEIRPNSRSQISAWVERISKRMINLERLV